MKISLDSNVFRDQLFIEWLESNSQKIMIEISVIVALETFYWYLLKGLTKKDFYQEIQHLRAKIQEIKLDDIFLIAENAQKSDLRIKHHARDFIIGTQAIKSRGIFITLNKKHFPWISTKKLFTPDEFTALFYKEK